MAKRDVELVIRAKNEASKAIESVSGALKTLTGVQKDVGDSAKRTDNLLGQLGQEFNQLSAQVQGLSALGRVAQTLERAAGAVGRLEAELSKTTSEQSRLSAEMQKSGATVSQLATAVKTAKAALEDQKRATIAARKEQTAANNEVKKAEAALTRLATKIAQAKEPSEALSKQYERQKTALAALQERQQSVVASYAGQQAALVRAKAAYADVTAKLGAAEKVQKSLKASIEGAAKALEAQGDSLTKARKGYSELEALASGASKSLGNVALTQEAVAKASADARAKLAQTADVLKSLQKFSTGGTAFADPKTAASVQKQREAISRAKDDWKNLEAETRRLAAGMRGSQGATEAQTVAFQQLVSASRAAKQEYLAQVGALAQLQGSARSTFSAFSQANIQARQTGAVQREAASGSRTLGSALRDLSNALAGVSAASVDTSKKVHGLRGQFGAIYGESRKALSFFQRLRGQLLGLGAAYIGLYQSISQIGGVIQSYRTLEAAQNRLGAIFNQNKSDVAREIGFLQREAARLGISFAVLSDEYGKFAVAAREAGFANETTRKIFLSVAEAARVNKLSLEQTSGVFLALQQMISKGKVTSEELRRQLGDRLPGAFNIMARAIGVTTAELDDMLKKGELFADQQTLLKFAEALDSRFSGQLPEALRSVTTEIGRLENELFQAQLRVAKGGFIDALQGALKNLNEFFKSREGRDFFLSLGAALGKFTTILAQVPKHFDLITAAIKVFVGYKLAQAFSEIAARLIALNASAAASRGAFFTWQGTMTALRGSMAALNGAVTALRGNLAGMTVALSLNGGKMVAFGAAATAAGRAIVTGLVGSVRLLIATLGGLPGVLITGLTFVVGSLLGDWLTSIDEATRAMDEHERIVNEVATAYENAKDKTADWVKEVKAVSLVDAEKNVLAQADAWDEASAAVTKYVGVFLTKFRSVRDVASDQLTSLADLVQEYRDGKIKATEFLKRLQDLNEEMSDDAAKEFARELIEVTEKLVKAEKAAGDAAIIAERFGSKLDVVKKTIETLNPSMDDLGASADAASDSFAEGNEKARIFNEALEAIKQKAGETGEAFKKLKEDMDLTEAVNNAVKAARSWRDVDAAELAGQRARVEIDGRRVGDEAVRATGKGIIDLIIHLESGGRAHVQNSKSSAGGLGQFTDSTWLEFFRRTYPEMSRRLTEDQIKALKFNAEMNRAVLENFTRHNAAELAKIGIPPSDEWIYTAHHFGINGARKFAEALKNGQSGRSIGEVLGADVVRANPWMQGKTVGEAWAWINNYVEKGRIAIGQGTVVQQQAEDLRKEQEKFNAEINKQIEAGKFEINNLKETARQQAINKALFDAENTAKEKGLTLSKAQREQIAQNAGALFDAQNKEKLASEERERIEKRVNDLYQLRKELMEQIEFAQNQGQTSKAEQLRQQLDGVNVELKEAIAAAVQFWSKTGGTEADLAIAKLNGMQNAVQTVKQSLLDARQVAENFASGLASAFDNAAQSIAGAISGATSWKEAIRGVRNAFLQFASDFLRQIAQMIIKQAVLNALQGGSGGTGGGGGLFGKIGGFFASLFHAGGVVGRGGQKRAASPAWFANAARFHGGGLPGLKANEVPAILRRKEEVLTEKDPRNILNGGASGGSRVKIINAFDGPSFLSEALNTTAGEQTLLNFVRANRGAVKAAMGV